MWLLRLQYGRKTCFSGWYLLFMCVRFQWCAQLSGYDAFSARKTAWTSNWAPQGVRSTDPLPRAIGLGKLTIAQPQPPCFATKLACSSLINNLLQLVWMDVSCNILSEAFQWFSSLVHLRFVPIHWYLWEFCKVCFLEILLTMSQISLISTTILLVALSNKLFESPWRQLAKSGITPQATRIFSLIFIQRFAKRIYILYTVEILRQQKSERIRFCIN